MEHKSSLLELKLMSKLYISLCLCLLKYSHYFYIHIFHFEAKILDNNHYTDQVHR